MWRRQPNPFQWLTNYVYAGWQLVEDSARVHTKQSCSTRRLQIAEEIWTTTVYICMHTNTCALQWEQEWGMLNTTEAAERETLKTLLALHYVVRHQTQLPNLKSRVGSVPVAVSSVARWMPVQTRRRSYNVWRGRRGGGLYCLWDILTCGMEHGNTPYNIPASGQTQTKSRCTYI